jgi:sirohydrochlorin ferrochelatase
VSAGPALLAVAHGSRDPRHEAALRGLIEAVRRADPGLRAEAAFLGLCGPSVDTALARLAASGAAEVVVVPLFLSRGYHVTHDIPRAATEARRALRHPPVVRVAAHLGPDPLLIEALDRRLRDQGVGRNNAPALVLCSAGSSDAAALAEVRLAARLWSSRPGSTGLSREGGVTLAFASAAAPSAAEAIATLKTRGARGVAVASYFLAPGLLLDRVTADARAARVPVAAPLTTPDDEPSDEVVCLVLARHAEAARRAREPQGEVVRTL